MSQLIAGFSGKKLLADNFTGITDPNVLPALDRAGNIANEHPRHVGMKENWHGGADGLSTDGHDPRKSGGVDYWGDVLRRWLDPDAAKFFLSFTRDPDGPKSGKPYSANVMLPLPTETINA